MDISLASVTLRNTCDGIFSRYSKAREEQLQLPMLAFCRAKAQKEWAKKLTGNKDD
jgi:hypothetical protein